MGRSRGEGRFSSGSRRRPTTSTAWRLPKGIITARGGATSHAAVVARQIGKPCVAGSADLVIEYGTKSAHCDRTGIDFKEGDWVSLDGSTGDLYLGALPTVSARFEDQPDLQTILGWADEVRRMQVWTNADKPEEAALARRTARRGSACAGPSTCSAKGSGSRSSGARSSWPCVATRAKAKAAAGGTLTDDEAEAVETFDAAMAKLEALQQGDFEGIFRAMDGLPVVIRLIDPPLHEFLPNLEEQLVKVTRAESTGGASDEDKELLATIKSLHEQNPMLGLRGCRLGLMIPDFVKVQTRAILNAQIAVSEGRRPSQGEDHDPARRSRERAEGDEGPARSRGEGGRRSRRHRGRVRVRDDDRGPPRRADGRRDRPSTPSSSRSARTT